MQTNPEPTPQQILRILKAAEGSYVSGSILAERLGLSRTGIWKGIRSLKSRGYNIESHSKEGYRLVSVPDAPIPEEVHPGLRTSWLGKSYHFFQQVGSTNDKALALAAEGAPHGTVVVAEEQTAGRGRLKRPWLSPPGCGLYISILIRTPLPVREAAHVTSITALSLVKILNLAYGVQAGVKWPNDVLVNGKKLAGILTEMQSDQDFTRFVVIGMGVNCNHSATDFEGVSFRYPATSIAVETGSRIKRQHLLTAFLEQFEREYARFVQGGYPAMMADLESVSAILHRNVTVHRGDEEIQGEALGFTPEGALILRKPDGQREIIWVGDVTRVEGAF